jgi:DNA-binding transcriptional MocR family regulator
MHPMALKLKVKSGSNVPLYRQIEQAIADAIGAGRLKPGERLPSVADLARQLDINKLTVVKAFRLLEHAGQVRSEVGRGTFVADGRNGAGAIPAPEPKPEVAQSIRRLRESYARGLRELIAVEWRPGTINLSGGVPNPAALPEDLFERLAREALGDNPRRLYEYGGPAGIAELREVLSRMLAARGVIASPDEIIVTNGSQQAITLVAAWTRDEGRAALCETPTYAGVPGSFMMFGHTVRSVPWTEDSPDLAHLRALATGRRSLFYLCPDFHNPTGRTMPVAAREELSEWTRHNDAIVLVDEIFRDLRFEGEHAPSLYSMLPPGRRVLVGSISKSFVPGLRVGFLVADRALIGELLYYKRYMDLGGPPLVQAMAAAFLRDGYAKFLDRIRAGYLTRRDAAISALEEHMPPGATWSRPQGGYQLWVTIPGVSSIQLFLHGIERGVAIVPGPVHDVDGGFQSSIRLGYGHESPEQIREGIRLLGEIARMLALQGGMETSGSALGVMV